MSYSGVNQLRLENWSVMDTSARLEVLQNLESQLASQEGRTENTIRFFPDNVPENQRGLFVPESRVENEQGYQKGIYINSKLVEDKEEPYQAVETTFHESRHAYQYHCSQNPEGSKEEPSVVEDWEKNYKGGYLSYPQNDYSMYRYQPVEKDANEVARLRTDDLFENQLVDKQYNNHKEAVLALNQRDQVLAEYKYGRNYESIAQEQMHNTYEACQNYQRQKNLKLEDQQKTPNDQLQINEKESQKVKQQVEETITNQGNQKDNQTDDPSHIRTNLEIKEQKFQEYDPAREYETPPLSPHKNDNTKEEKQELTSKGDVELQKNQQSSELTKETGKMDSEERPGYGEGYYYGFNR